MLLENTKSSKAFIGFSLWSSIVFVCFSNASPCREYVNLGFSVFWLWSEGNIFSPERCSYLSIFPVNGGIFAASLLILYCCFHF